MKKLSLNDVAEEFEMITPETHMFYNKETGEFEQYNEFFLEDIDIEKYEENVWIASPTAQDINEYEIMMDFAKQISDAQLQHRLVVALSGKGAFRRFKDVCLNTGLIEAWYKFKHKEYIAIAKEWCNNAGLAYEIVTVQSNGETENKKITRPQTIPTNTPQTQNPTQKPPQ